MTWLGLGLREYSPVRVPWASEFPLGSPHWSFRISSILSSWQSALLLLWAHFTYSKPLELQNHNWPYIHFPLTPITPNSQLPLWETRSVNFHAYKYPPSSLSSGFQLSFLLTTTSSSFHYNALPLPTLDHQYTLFSLHLCLVNLWSQLHPKPRDILVILRLNYQ